MSQADYPDETSVMAKPSYHDLELEIVRLRAELALWKGRYEGAVEGHELVTDMDDACYDFGAARKKLAAKRRSPIERAE